MAERLPDECWELIFNKLGHHSYFQDVILVCKRFLSIISYLHTTLNLTHPAIIINPANLYHIFTQFPNIKTISLSAIRGHVTVLLDQVTSSSLDLESLDISHGSFSLITLQRFRLLGEKMKHLKILKCRKMHRLTNKNLEVVADCFPQLEELDISGPHVGAFSSELLLTSWDMNVTDFGIEMVSLKLHGLKKINISGNQFLTDKSLMAISSNCGFLEEVVVKNCVMITSNGIEFVLMNCLNIKSLVFSGIAFEAAPDLFSRAFSSARCLSTLDIADSGVSDEFLYSLAGSGILLKRFTLSSCFGFSCDGITFFFKKHRSLDYLSIVNANCLDDSSVAEWSSSLCLLTTITLKMCYLTVSTFFKLAKSCPLLEHIDMGKTEIGSWDSSIDFAMNPRIKSLRLSCNPKLSDECLGGLALVCPFLETLDVSCCLELTDKGISDILGRCRNIRHLETNGCVGVKSIGQGSRLPYLKVLKAVKSGVNDEGLAMIGKRCCELLNLDLAGCLEVTTEGLKGVVEDCRGLREINLNECRNVSIDFIDWMVFSRSSLKKIIPPCSSIPSFQQMELYLRHGCRVWTDAFDG